MSTENRNPHITSHERPDLNTHVIKSVADSFIQAHGLRDIHSGEERDINHLDTMAAELNMIMAQAALGLAQVVPLIAFWVSEFSLDFKDELFEIEHKRLQRTQSIADHLSSFTEQNQQVEITIKLPDLLAELTAEEMMHAIPILEEHLKHSQNADIKPLSEQAGLIDRLKYLLRLPENEIHLSFDAEQLFPSQQHFSLPPSMNATDETQSLEQQAQSWLDRINRHEAHSLPFFIDAYNREPPELRAAIDHVLAKQNQKRAYSDPTTKQSRE